MVLIVNRKGYVFPGGMRISMVEASIQQHGGQRNFFVVGERMMQRLRNSSWTGEMKGKPTAFKRISGEVKFFAYTVRNTMSLEKEIATYNANLPELRQHEGKFVLIHGDDVIDLFSSYDDALKEGYKRFGVRSFMVKQIHSVEPVYYFTRPIMASRKAVAR
jgi:hypothetical protein